MKYKIDIIYPYKRYSLHNKYYTYIISIVFYLLPAKHELFWLAV